MGQLQDLVAQVTDVGYEDTPAMQQQPGVRAPWRRQVSRVQAMQQLLRVRGVGCSAADRIQEGEGRPRDGPGRARACCSVHSLGVTPGQCVGHGVEAARAIFHREVEAEKLAEPLMLGNCGQALVKQKFKTVMISTDQKVTPPQIRSPMMNGLHQPDEFALISRKLEMADSERPAAVGEGSSALVKDGTKPRTRRVAIHDEEPVEVRHLQDWPRSEGGLECLKRRGRVVVPSKRVSPQETCQRGSDDAEILNELPVVACEA